MSNRFTDEDLTAFLDNECEAELAARIASALESDAELRARLDELKLDKDELSAAFEVLTPSAVSIDDLPTPYMQPRFIQSPLSKVAAGLVLGVMLGAAAVMFAPNSKEDDWRQVIASYQALYTTETLAFVDQTETEMSQELLRVSAAIEKTIELANLNAISELSYKRAQVLAFQGQKVIQLAFLDEAGQAFALCITRSDQTSSSGLRLSSLEGLEAASWTGDGYNYIFIGGQDRAFVSDAAQNFLGLI